MNSKSVLWERALRIIEASTGIALSFGLIFALFLLLRQILLQIASLDPNVAAAIIAALTAVFSVLYSQWQNKKKEIAESHRAEKVDLYKEYMKVTFGLLYSTKKGTLDPKHPSDEMERQFFDIKRDLIVWASPRVVSLFGDFTRAAHGKEPKDILLLMDDLLRAIRSDLRVSNRGLGRGDLIKMFLSDPESLDKEVMGE
jgi:hypothetical protein